MESTLTRRGLNGNQLKLIAITAMTIDHLAWTLWPGYSHNPAAIACHIMGRLTAPIMWFFIVEGYHYTHDVNKYTLRLFILALVSHLAHISLMRTRFWFPKHLFLMRRIMKHGQIPY